MRRVRQVALAAVWLCVPLGPWAARADDRTAAGGAPRTRVAGDVAGAAAADVSGETAASLERLRQEAETRRARVEAYQRQEQGLLDTIDGIDRATSRIQSELAAARREARTAAATQALLAERLRVLEAERTATQRALAERTRRLYREGRGNVLRILSGAESLRDLIGRMRAARRRVESDTALLVRARSEHAALEATRLEAAAAARTSEQALRAERARARALAEERAAREQVLAALRVGGARERSALAEIEAAARALEEALAGLGATPPSQPAPAVSFASLRGRLPAPAIAPIVRGFGRVVDAEFHTATFRKGIDFAAPAGAAVRAVAPGAVRFAGWFRGYGKMAILDHGEGYFTVYAHLDELAVAVGDAVDAGRTLGTVGDTGSLSGPLLYFEIRHNREPMDPSRWLAGGTGLE